MAKTAKPAKPGMTKIRKAVLKNRAGLENATDSQIMTLWAALDDETRGIYLKSVSE